MFRRSRTREPTCTSIGFGLSPLWRAGRRICWCIAIFGRLPLQKRNGTKRQITPSYAISNRATRKISNSDLAQGSRKPLARDSPRRSVQPQHDRKRAKQKKEGQRPISNACVGRRVAWRRQRDVGV